MNDTTELPVPRAERSRNHPDAWNFHLGGYGTFTDVRESSIDPGDSGVLMRALVETAKLREELAGCQNHESIMARLKDALGLPEAYENIGVLETACNVIHGSRDLVEKREERLKELEAFRKNVRQWTDSPHEPGEPGDKVILDRIVTRFGECRETLQQIENLGRFIGHPGATAAHVVSETVSLLEKCLKVAASLGLVGGNTGILIERMCAKVTGMEGSLYLKARLRAEEAEGLIEKMSGMPYHKGGKTWVELRIADAEQRQNEAPESFKQELAALINRRSLENDSDTPDFILADFLQGMLEQWNAAVAKRAEWYGGPAEKTRMPEVVEAMDELLVKVTESPWKIVTIDPGFPDGDAATIQAFYPANHASKEGDRLKALRDDVNLPIDIRRQAAIALQMWEWFQGPQVTAPSECLERGLPMLKEDEK